MDSSNFCWFVLSMRMQVILDSLFARPGSAPIGGGKKGEFRDWTKKEIIRMNSLTYQLRYANEFIQIEGRRKIYDPNFV